MLPVDSICDQYEYEVGEAHLSGDFDRAEIEVCGMSVGGWIGNKTADLGTVFGNPA